MKRCVSFSDYGRNCSRSDWRLLLRRNNVATAIVLNRFRTRSCRKVGNGPPRICRRKAGNPVGRLPRKMGQRISKVKKCFLHLFTFLISRRAPFPFVAARRMSRAGQRRFVFICRCPQAKRWRSRAWPVSRDSLIKAIDAGCVRKKKKKKRQSLPGVGTGRLK